MMAHRHQKPRLARHGANLGRKTYKEAMMREFLEWVFHYNRPTWVGMTAIVSALALAAGWIGCIVALGAWLGWFASVLVIAAPFFFAWRIIWREYRNREK